MQIGKYEVTVEATRNPDTGKFHGYLTRSWSEGTHTLSQPTYFDKGFDTAEDAKRHAIEQATVRVTDEFW